MENIERTHFVVLTGHLDEQPLPDLFRTLRVQRKSGRLQVEYPESPGAFFFEEGQLVDAQLGSLRGLEAVHAALALRGASFNFNPLVRPPERSINRQEQKFINDLAEVPRREAVPEIRAVGGVAYTGPAPLPPPQQAAPLQLAPVPSEVLAPLEARLTAVEEAILSSSQRLSRERLVYAVVISFLVGLAAVMAYAAVFNPFQPAPATLTKAASAAPPAQKTDAAAAAVPGVQAGQTAAAALPQKKEPETTGAAEPRRGDAPAPKPPASKKAEPSKAEQAQSQRQAQQAASREAKATAKKAAASETTEEGGYVVNVLVQVNRGRVISARVIDSRPSASAYEAAAVSKARQRQYPENFTGGERLRIVVRQ